jgi:hypothetical protein
LSILIGIGIPLSSFSFFFQRFYDPAFPPPSSRPGGDRAAVWNSPEEVACDGE